MNAVLGIRHELISRENCWFVLHNGKPLTSGSSFEDCRRTITEAKKPLTLRISLGGGLFAIRLTGGVLPNREIQPWVIPFLESCPTYWEADGSNATALFFGEPSEDLPKVIDLGQGRVIEVVSEGLIPITGQWVEFKGMLGLPVAESDGLNLSTYLQDYVELSNQLEEDNLILLKKESLENLIQQIFQGSKDLESVLKGEKENTSIDDHLKLIVRLMDFFEGEESILLDLLKESNIWGQMNSPEEYFYHLIQKTKTFLLGESNSNEPADSSDSNCRINYLSILIPTNKPFVELVNDFNELDPVLGRKSYMQGGEVGASDCEQQIHLCDSTKPLEINNIHRPLADKVLHAVNIPGFTSACNSFGKRVTCSKAYEESFSDMRKVIIEAMRAVPEHWFTTQELQFLTDMKRTACTRLLGRMQKEGIIRKQKGSGGRGGAHFKLIAARSVEIKLLSQRYNSQWIKSGELAQDWGSTELVNRIVQTLPSYYVIQGSKSVEGKTGIKISYTLIDASIASAIETSPFFDHVRRKYRLIDKTRKKVVRKKPLVIKARATAAKPRKRLRVA